MKVFVISRYNYLMQNLTKLIDNVIKNLATLAYRSLMFLAGVYAKRTNCILQYKGKDGKVFTVAEANELIKKDPKLFDTLTVEYVPVTTVQKPAV